MKEKSWSKATILFYFILLFFRVKLLFVSGRRFPVTVAHFYVAHKRFTVSIDGGSSPALFERVHRRLHFPECFEDL